MAKRATTYSVVIPVCNEAENIPELHRRISAVFRRRRGNHEIVFVDDASTDDSFRILKDLHRKNKRVKVVRLARNFGQHTAIDVGLRQAAGKTVVVMDGDLQNPPEEIPKLLDKLAQGYDLVYGLRKERKGNLFRKLGSKLAGRLMNALLAVRIPDGTTAFLALDGKLVEQAKLFREKSKFTLGLLSWLAEGRTASVETEHQERTRGKSKYTFWRLVNLTFNLIVSFSTSPLRLAGIIGFVAAILGLLFALVIVFKKIFLGIPVAGYASIICLILAFCGVQLITIGIIGEYVGRIYNEVREGPAYVIREVLK